MPSIKDFAIIEKRLTLLSQAVNIYVTPACVAGLSFIEDKALRHQSEVTARSFFRCVAAFLNLCEVRRKTVATYAMARQFPWRNNSITQSDHFEFVWFQFVNLCYLFKERYKASAKAFNYLGSSYQENIAHGVKVIEKRPSRAQMAV